MRLDFATGNRWSRQVLTSEWKPMVHTLSQFSETPSDQVSLVESLSPESKQQYHHEQVQLHRARNGIQKLLAIQQQQHRNQQEIHQVIKTLRYKHGKRRKLDIAREKS